MPCCLILFSSRLAFVFGLGASSAELSSLFPVQTTTFQPLKGGHPAFRHGILLKSEFRPELGSACEETTDSPARPGRAFFKALARHQSIHRGSRSHAVKRAQGTNRTSTIACRPGLVTIKSEGRRRFKFLAQYIAPQGTRLLSRNFRSPTRESALRVLLFRGFSGMKAASLTRVEHTTGRRLLRAVRSVLRCDSFSWLR